ncbi:MAG: M20/M25/M40 family metallo-hydrolase [Candidatus Heimdallarchaeota archaeon]|nr:M20/M25/M40 family metallo-hydrolase [Candidatus Heimdallarchaeota archaeon]
MPSRDDLIKLVVDESYLRSLLEEMIEINSIVGNERNLALYLAQELQMLGLAIQLEDVQSNRPNVYAHYSFDEKGKTLTYNGHLDTVDICNGWSENPFLPYEKGGSLYGLGSIDMKAGIACEIAAIKALLDSDENIKGKIHFTAVIDEEGYGTGSRKMLTNPFFGKGKTDGIIIAEPFNGSNADYPIPLGMTGKILYKIVFSGKSAHAFHPDDGINAIDDASKFIACLKDYSTDKKIILPSDDDFGQGNLCTLKIEGGYKTYSVVVPDTCEIILNRLLIPGESKESALFDMQKFIADLKLSSEVSLEIIPPFYLPYKISKQESLFHALLNSYTQIIKRAPIIGYKTMITDANIFVGEGQIPTVLFGPSGGNIHSADEYVTLSSLEPTVQTLAQTYLAFQGE